MNGELNSHSNRCSGVQLPNENEKKFELLRSQHALDRRRICRADQSAAAQTALSFLIFAGENVTMAAAAAFDFARGGELETLLCAALGFQFRHDNLSIS